VTQAPLADRHRPRVEGDREDQILDEVLQILIEVGYDKLSFDTVATRARASKATLYRRWPTKVDLVINALDRIALCPAGRADVLDTGTLMGDLEQLACSDPEWTKLLPGIVSAIVPALNRDGDLTTAFHQQFLMPRQRLMTQALQRAQRRGEIGRDADLDLLSGILPALTVYHTVLHGLGPDSDSVRRAITGVLLPACRATRTADAGGGGTG